MLRDFSSADATAKQVLRDKLEHARRQALRDQEQRVHELVHEDLRKEIPAVLSEIHEESLKNKGIAVSPITRTLARFASLLGVLFLKADIQTRRVINLTRALVVLTVALLLFTVYLSYDAYLKNRRADQERKDRTEKSESHVDIYYLTVPY